MLHEQEGRLNIFLQFMRILVVSAGVISILVLLPVLLLLLLAWFTWKNVKYAVSIHNLPARTTDVVTNMVVRRFASPFARYIGWFSLNYVFECFKKALKHNRTSLRDARHALSLVTTLTHQMKQVGDVAEKMDVGDEFEEVSYERFQRRNKKYWSLSKGMIVSWPMKCVLQFALSVNESDELVFYVAARQVFNFIRKIPYVGKWRWVNKGLSSVQEALYVKKFRSKVREGLLRGVRVYIDNMMRTCFDYGALNAIDAWSLTMKEFSRLVEIEPTIANEGEIAEGVIKAADLMNEAGRQTFVVIAQNDGFKIAQDGYIDVTVNSSAVCEQLVGSVVYVEGRTDEKYFNRALKAYGLNVCFRYAWIGTLDSKGNEVNGGAGALKNAASVYSIHNPPDRIVIQFDCDQPHQDKKMGNVLIRSVAKYKNKKNCMCGVENALVLDSIDQDKWEAFFDKRAIKNDYGKDGVKYDLQKMKLCEYICSLSDEECREIFKNLKIEIDKVVKWFGS